MNVPEQPALLGLAEGRPAFELACPADVVQQCSGNEEIRAQARVELRRLAAERRDADGVLEQAARVRVVGLRSRQRPQRRAQRLVRDEAVDGLAQPLVRDLAGQKLEEAVELGRVAAQGRRELGRIGLGRLERTHVKLEPVAEALHAPEYVHGVTFREAVVEQLDVRPDPSLDPAARVHELERQVRRPASRPPPFLACDRVDALDHPVFGKGCDRAHAGSFTVMADVRPFRAVRYDESVAGPLAGLVAPPYDVISHEQREGYLARSPHNVVHLTLPADEAEARRLWDDWRAEGALVEEREPGFWWLSQDYVGPDGIARTREGLVAALKAEPYESRVVLPHERTHRGPKEGRLRLMRAVEAQLEPLFFLYEGEPVASRPDREPDLEVEGARLWRLSPEGIQDAFADRQLLIADGHHRYETALAYGADVDVLAVLVSLDDPGLMIFPTHRVFERAPGEQLAAEETLPGPAQALQALERIPPDRAAAVVYRDGRSELAVDGNELDVQLVDRLGHEGISYTPDWEQAVRAVDSGEAEVAVLMRPTRIEDVFAVAKRGETMPQKSTYFYPKLVSGLLFLPLA
jgi:uncharacterized protein (DUF1015 family)